GAAEGHRAVVDEGSGQVHRGSAERGVAGGRVEGAVVRIQDQVGERIDVTDDVVEDRRRADFQTAGTVEGVGEGDGVGRAVGLDVGIGQQDHRTVVGLGAVVGADQADHGEVRGVVIPAGGGVGGVEHDGAGGEGDVASDGGLDRV